jgi:hypothetical protein
MIDLALSSSSLLFSSDCSANFYNNCSRDLGYSFLLAEIMSIIWFHFYNSYIFILVTISS